MVEKGDLKATISYGKILYEDDGVEKSDKKAAGCFKLASYRWDVYAICCNAIMFKTGSGVEYSLKKAFRIFQRAADIGDKVICKTDCEDFGQWMIVLVGKKRVCKIL